MKGGVLVSLVLALCAASPAAASGAVDALALMRAVDQRERGGDQAMTTLWRLVRKNGAERRRTLRSYWKDYRTPGRPLHSKRIVVFEAPPDLEDTAFLVASPLDPAEDDERWIYLPALRKVRRIAGRDRGQSFFGTDFAYEDLAERGPDEDVPVFERTEGTGASLRHVITATPREAGFPYAKRRLWIDPSNATVSRIEYFAGPNRLTKTLSVEWQRVGRVWAWKRLEMQSVATGHRTIVDVLAVEHGVGLPEALFSESSLQLGVPKE